MTQDGLGNSFGQHKWLHRGSRIERVAFFSKPELGIECEPIRVDDYTGKKMTFFHDPDGLPLELHE